MKTKNTYVLGRGGGADLSIYIISSSGQIRGQGWDGVGAK